MELNLRAACHLRFQRFRFLFLNCTLWNVSPLEKYPELKYTLPCREQMKLLANVWLDRHRRVKGSKVSDPRGHGISLAQFRVWMGTESPPTPRWQPESCFPAEAVLAQTANPVSMIQLYTLNAAHLSLTTPPPCPAVCNNLTLCSTLYDKYTDFLGCYGFPSRQPRPAQSQLFWGSACVCFFFIPLPPPTHTHSVRVKSLEAMHGRDTAYILSVNWS